MRFTILVLAFIVGLSVPGPSPIAAPTPEARSLDQAAPQRGESSENASDRVPAATLEVYRVLFDTYPIPDSQTDPVAPPLGRRNLEFRFGIEGLLPSDSLSVEFRMEGFDEAWVSARNRRVAYYRDLPPGTYTFRVRARPANGAWSIGDAVPVYIEPHFYETWWFIALAILGLFATLSGVFWSQTRQTRRLARLVEERTEALRVERDRAEEALEKARLERATSVEALETVEQQTAQLRAMDEAKSRLFANLSHEFRTPLTLILDPLERAVKGELGDLDGYTTHALDLARLNATRLLRLINQLLDLSKLEAGGIKLRARELDLVHLLQDATDLFAAEAERLGVRLLFRTDDQRFPVFADREKVEKIVFNLISNALKATPHGGKVLVTLQRVDPERSAGKKGHHNGHHSNGDAPSGAGFAEITVRDTGVGIPKGDLDHIFDRFYQTDAGVIEGGTGIGLSLVKELVDLHRGEIVVDSEPGFGSAFTVRLPLGSSHLLDGEMADAPDDLRDGDLNEAPSAKPADAQAPHLPLVIDARLSSERVHALDEPAPSTEPPANGADARPLILIVDDNAELLQLLRTYLAPRYRLIEASNGQQALRLARERRPDAIVSDILMPIMDGLNLCRHVRHDEALADTPVILLTAVASDESRLAGLDTGADHYLTKPFIADELLTSVRNVLRRRDVLRELYSDEVVLQPLGLPVQSSEVAFMKQAFAVIEEHLGDGDFTVAQLADDLGVSQSQLKRKLRATVDQSPVELIRTYRLERAAQLLRGHAGSVSEVAYRVGFSSASYFSKVFREHVGRLPSEVRDESGDAADGADEAVDMDCS